MNYPRISIVTPSFNQGEHLEQTILSVISQNYPNLEYVIIDGGSTDNSVEIIKKYESYLSYWVSEKDEGQYYAIKKGFSHTKGEIMGWINSSDLLYPWTLNTLAMLFNEFDIIEWVTGLPTHISAGTGPQNVSQHKFINKYDIIGFNHKWIQQESTFWRRTVWNKVNGLDLNFKSAADFKLWIDFFKYTDLYFMNTILGCFRFHNTRRGAEKVYEQEVNNLITELRKNNIRDRIKSDFIKYLTLNSSLLKRKLSHKKTFSWYRHPEIFYDFTSNRWRIK
ncbi:glycosyltransferase family 2 protein [Saccharicrinis sp. FJH54]|uniref:glycosyltransferase family 2 protein n=1 Tax=Saccharicrinis sp. FJH54 TaxID=3344665 RepID=UPI0035D4A921